MRRKPLPKAITRSIANLQQIAAGFATDEQGRVPPQHGREAAGPAFDAVEPEPPLEVPAMPDIAINPIGQQPAESTHQAKSPAADQRIADPLAARRRALARRIVDRHRNYAAMGGLVPLPAANIASVTAVNLRMVRQLSELYGVPFQRDRTRSLIIALIAGAVPTGAGLAASSTLMWIVPGGLVWGLGAAALTAGALTRGIGLVFLESFEADLAQRDGA
jgi:uncharacterized protein (DUF697 family)